ncbi:4756_t:CDS:2, partial [Dentiscutata erythropus]
PEYSEWQLTVGFGSSAEGNLFPHLFIGSCHATSPESGSYKCQDSEWQLPVGLQVLHGTKNNSRLGILPPTSSTAQFSLNAKILPLIRIATSFLSGFSFRHGFRLSLGFAISPGVSSFVLSKLRFHLSSGVPLFAM